MSLCAECEQAELEPTTAEDTIEVAGLVFRAVLPALKCPLCGALYFDGPSVERFDLAVAVRLAQAGQASGEVAKFLRKTLALRATDLAELLGVTPETVSR